MYRIYGDSQSGNCYKVKLLMNHLGLEYEWVEMDILEDDTKTDAFLAKNLEGRIPLLDIDAERQLPESNAILNYFAEGTEYLPSDSWEKANVLRWQFFEQYSHEPYIAVARFIAKYLGLPSERREEFEAKKKGGEKALFIMNRHLDQREFFVGDRMTIADISLIRIHACSSRRWF